MMSNPNDNREIDDETQKKLDKHFQNVKASAIELPKETVTRDDDNFFDKSGVFWRQHEGGLYYKEYDSGVMNGTFNDRRPTYKSIMDTFTEALKHSIRIECEKDDKTTEELTDLFDLVDQSVSMLNSNLERHLSHRPNGVSLMAHLHGVFNAFVQQNIKRG